MPTDRIPAGTILATIPVGTAETCPPGKNCPGKIWSADFCAIFGEKLERVDPGHRYRKCGECVAAEVAYIAVQEKDRKPLPPPRRFLAVDVFKDQSK